MYIKRKNHSGSLKAFTIEPLAKIISNIDFKPAVAPAKVPPQMLVSVHRMPLQMNTTQLLSSNGVALMANKDNIILINYLHLQFRSVNCLKIRRPLKKPPKLTFPGRSQMRFFRNFFCKPISRHLWQSSVPNRAWKEKCQSEKWSAMKLNLCRPTIRQTLSLKPRAKTLSFYHRLSAGFRNVVRLVKY